MYQDDLEGNYNLIMDKIMRTAEDSTDLGARVGARLENESRRIDAMVKVRVEGGIQRLFFSLKGDLML